MEQLLRAARIKEILSLFVLLVYHAQVSYAEERIMCLFCSIHTSSPSCRLLLLPAFIVSPTQFQLEKLLLGAWGSPDSMLERSAEVRVQGQWGENARAGGILLGGLEGGVSPG